MVRVEEDRERIRLREHVTPRLPAHDAPRIAIVEPCTDVQRIGVVEDAQLRTLRHWRSLVGIALAEVREHRRVAPRGIVQAAVDARRSQRPDGGDWFFG